MLLDCMLLLITRLKVERFSLQDDVLLAYQVCFNLFENEMQAFLLKVELLLPDLLR